ATHSSEQAIVPASPTACHGKVAWVPEADSFRIRGVYSSRRPAATAAVRALRKLPNTTKTFRCMASRRARWARPEREPDPQPTYGAVRRADASPLLRGLLRSDPPLGPA